jgi:hypothetical protein
MVRNTEPDQQPFLAPYSRHSPFLAAPAAVERMSKTDISMGYPNPSSGQTRVFRKMTNFRRILNFEATEAGNFSAFGKQSGTLLFLTDRKKNNNLPIFPWPFRKTDIQTVA